MRQPFLAAACLLLTATSSFAEDYPVETIARGKRGLGLPTCQLVARSSEDLYRFHLRGFLTDGQARAIDWRRDMVIAVFLGEEDTDGHFLGEEDYGGYGIRITGIHRRVPQTVPDHDTCSARGEITIDVLKDHPIYGAVSDDPPGQPFHIIKLPRSNDRVLFAEVPNRIEFSSFTRSGSGSARSIRVDEAGVVTVLTPGSDADAAGRIERGKAHEGHLDRLRRALALSSFRSIPADMGLSSGDRFLLRDAQTMSYALEHGDRKHFVSGFRRYAPGEIETRLSLIDRELDLIADEALPAFQSVVLSTLETVDGESTATYVGVDSKGNVVVEKRSNRQLGHPTMVQGRAPKALIAELDAAIRAARVDDSLRAPTLRRVYRAKNAFRLSVNATQDLHSYRDEGDMEGPGFRTRYLLKRVFEAVAAIRDHVLQSAGHEEALADDSSLSPDGPAIPDDGGRSPPGEGGLLGAVRSVVPDGEE